MCFEACIFLAFEIKFLWHMSWESFFVLFSNFNLSGFPFFIYSPKTVRTIDSKELRKTLRKKGIRPEIPKRTWSNRKQPKGRKLQKKVERYVVERTFSWYQRKFRRLVVRWERKPNIFEAFVDLGFVMIWLDKILLG